MKLRMFSGTYEPSVNENFIIVIIIVIRIF